MTEAFEWLRSDHADGQTKARRGVGAGPDLVCYELNDEHRHTF
jgi:hypothetical protein